MKQIRKAFIRLAYENPEIRPKVLPVVRSAAWEKLPRGWTQESVEKFWDTLTGDAKHKVTKCIKRMEGKFDDPGAFCASLADKVDPGWRSRRAAAYDDLGTPFRFKVIPGRLGIVYALNIEGEEYRIAPERDRWRLDQLGMLGQTWEAITPIRYDTPQDAADDLHRKYKSRMSKWAGSFPTGEGSYAVWVDSYRGKYQEDEIFAPGFSRKQKKGAFKDLTSVLAFALKHLPKESVGTENYGQDWVPARVVPGWKIPGWIADRTDSPFVWEDRLAIFKDKQPLPPAEAKLVLQALRTGRLPRRVPGEAPRDIKVTYSSIDGVYKTARFKTLAGAQAFAQKWLGKTPEIGGWYAVSGDGMGKIEAQGATLQELFPDSFEGRMASQLPFKLSKQAALSDAMLRKMLSKKVFEVGDGDQTWTDSGWEIASVNMEDEEVMNFLLTSRKGETFGGGHALELRRIK